MQWLGAQMRGEKFFFIDCSFELIKERFVKHDEKDLDIKDWKEHRRVFHDVMKLAEDNYSIKIARVDTTTDTVSQSGNKIIKDIIA